METIGLAVLRLGIALLPGDIRQRVGEPLLATFEERQREKLRVSGRLALVPLWLSEGAGLLRLSFRARIPSRWARRTEPRDPPSGRPDPSSEIHVMDDLITDIRFAVRTFVRKPGMSLLAIGTLALGIGASTAMFSVTESVLLKPLDYPNPENLYSVYPTWPELRGHPTLGDLADRGTWSWPEFFQVREDQRVFSQLAAWQPVAMTLSGAGRPEQVSMGEATPGLFSMLGVTPILGRLFDPEDGTSGQDQVVILTAGYWRDRFGADRGLIGRTITLDAEPYTVIGVLPDDFELTGINARMWKPKAGAPTDQGLGNHGGTRALARLAEGVGPADAMREVERILQTELPPSHGAHGASVFLRSSEETRTVRPVLFGLLFASGLLLLVACANVAALLLGAGIDRERELALRGALGAARHRIARQMFTESVLLSLVAAVLGVVVAAVATQGLVYLAPPGVPRLDEAALSPGVLGFALLLAMVFGVGFGSIPAMSLSGGSLAATIGSTRSTSRGRARLQSLLVVGELGLATVLVVGGSLLARTVSALDDVELGFDREGLVVAAIAAPTDRFRAEDGSVDDLAVDRYYRDMLEEIEQLPGVTGATVSSVPPLFGWRGNNGVFPEGWDDPESQPVAERRFVEASYFATLGVPLVEGRAFNSLDDREGSEPVVIVSEGLADLAWPNESALGKTLGYWQYEATVVGVAANIRDEELDRVTELAYYAPGGQAGGLGGPFIVRVTGDAADMITPIRDRIWSVDGAVPVTRIQTLDQLSSARIASHRYRARLILLFATLAGLFSLLGVYGVTARSVARRTQEMGIRVALGARRSHVRGLVTAQALRLGIFGVVAGTAASLLAGRAIERFLWGVSSADPFTFVLVAVALPAAAGLAALAPAVRATRVSPLEALRAE